MYLRVWIQNDKCKKIIKSIILKKSMVLKKQIDVVLANKERDNISNQGMKIVCLDSENNLKKY